MIAIIGNGCVGKGLAYLLNDIGIEVTLLGRSGPVSCDQGVKVSDQPLGKLKLGARRSTATEDFDLVLVTVKAYSLLEAAEQHFPAFSPGTTVVCLTNGYVVPEINELAKIFPQLTLRAGVVRIGFKENSGCLEISSTKGGVSWGPIAGSNNSSRSEQELLETSLCNWVDDPLRLIREKWLQNVVINHLSVYFSSKKNLDLIAHSETVAEVYSEAYGFGEELWGTWEFSEVEGYQDLVKLIRLTSDNENSMMCDTRLGRQTEAKFLAGIVGSRDGYPWLSRFAGY